MHAVLIGHKNYFAGMRITTFSAAHVELTDQSGYSKKVLPTQRQKEFDDIDPGMVGINKTLPPYTYSENGGYMDRGGFVKFIKANTTQKEATGILK